jgi:hypothetical protein
MNQSPEDQIKQLRTEADDLLKLMKSDIPNYKLHFNKYVSTLAKIRYRTRTDIREYKRDYYNKKKIANNNLYPKY